MGTGLQAAAGVLLLLLLLLLLPLWARSSVEVLATLLPLDDDDEPSPSSSEEEEEHSRTLRSARLSAVWTSVRLLRLGDVMTSLQSWFRARSPKRNFLVWLVPALRARHGHVVEVAAAAVVLPLRAPAR